MDAGLTDPLFPGWIYRTISAGMSHMVKYREQHSMEYTLPEGGRELVPSLIQQIEQHLQGTTPNLGSRVQSQIW